MGKQSTSTSTRQEHRTVAGAMLLVLILSLVCAQWLSHYRAGISEDRFEPDFDIQEKLDQLKHHAVDTLDLQLPEDWQPQSPVQTSDVPGVRHESHFIDVRQKDTRLHVFELDAGQTQGPQAVIYAAIRHAVGTADVSSLSVAHQWASRQGNRMQRRLLAISRTDGVSVLHHLLIWTHDGRRYWVFYTRHAAPGQAMNSAALARFDKIQTAIALLAQDNRFELTTPEACRQRQLGYTANLSDWYATCDTQSPGVVLLYPDSMDGFCVIRVARSVSLDDATIKQYLSWQFQGTMKRKPTDKELIKVDGLANTTWHRLQYPVDKDYGVGPEPLSRQVHIIEPHGQAALVIEVTGEVDSVQSVDEYLPDIAAMLAQTSDALAGQMSAIERGKQWVAYAPQHLKQTIKDELNVYAVHMADQWVGYQLESIKRESDNLASSFVHVVFPSAKGDSKIDHFWEVDFDKQVYHSATQEKIAEGKDTHQSLKMSDGKIVCESNVLDFTDENAADIPWPINEDFWPVDWFTQQGWLDQWLLVRTAYTASPPILHWVRLEKTTLGYRLLRRPVVCLDTNQYRFDDQGHFEALDGFDFEAGQSSTLSLSVQRVNVNQVYNQWPGHQKAIAQWIKDHESTVR